MLHHLELYVSNLRQSRLFYDFLLTRLGYVYDQEWEEGFSMSYASGSANHKNTIKELPYLVFVQTPSDFLEAGYHRCRTGLNHLAFEVGTPVDVDCWRQACIERQIPLLYDDRYPYAGGKDHYALYIEDPDGVKIELIGRKQT